MAAELPARPPEGCSPGALRSGDSQALMAVAFFTETKCMAGIVSSRADAEGTAPAISRRQGRSCSPLDARRNLLPRHSLSPFGGLLLPKWLVPSR